jgi:hypothetical protein
MDGPLSPVKKMKRGYGIGAKDLRIVGLYNAARVASDLGTGT